MMNYILIGAAALISWLVFTWLLRVAKTTMKTAFLVAAIVMILQVVLGIGPDQVWRQVTELPQLIQDWLSRQQ